MKFLNERTRLLQTPVTPFYLHSNTAQTRNYGDFEINTERFGYASEVSLKVSLE